MSNVQFVIITGLSGAGKSEAVHCFEDLGFFCVDNLPPALIPKFAELCLQSEGRVNKIALVSDVRGGKFFDSLEDALADLERMGFGYEILYLEADDATLVRRFKETRRRHPLATDGAIVDAIAQERRKLEGIRGRAHRIMNTATMGPRQLHQEIEAAFASVEGGPKMAVTVISFGFKHGVPIDADMLFDVRFLPNPHYVASLKPFSGMDPQVAEYVFKWPLATQFVEKVNDMLGFLMPQFVKEGKAHLLLAIGCTGGRHRSVAIAERVGAYLRTLGYRVGVDHRDIHRSSDEPSSIA